MPKVFGWEYEMKALLQGFVDSWQEDVENDEPIAGTDAVYALVDLYYDAKKLLVKAGE